MCYIFKSMGVKDIKYDIPMDMVDMDSDNEDNDNKDNEDNDNDNDNKDNETKTMKTMMAMTKTSTGQSTGPKACNLSHSRILWTTGHGHSGPRK